VVLADLSENPLIDEERTHARYMRLPVHPLSRRERFRHCTDMTGVTYFCAHEDALRSPDKAKKGKRVGGVTRAPAQVSTVRVNLHAHAPIGRFVTGLNTKPWSGEE